MIAYGKQPIHYPCDAVGPVQSVGSLVEHTTIAGTECLIVEGDSAAKSVNQVRDVRTQAVLSLQGKPLNAVKASQQAALNNDIFLRIFETLLGYRLPVATAAASLQRQLEKPERCVYERLVVLMDPDADGIHCGVLMMAFFRRYASRLIADGRVVVVRPPMFVFRLPAETPIDVSRWPVASSPEHADAVERTLRAHGIEHFEKTRHRGLGSLDVSLLRHTSVENATRRQSVMTLDEVDQAIALFGG